MSSAVYPHKDGDADDLKDKEETENPYNYESEHVMHSMNSNEFVTIGLLKKELLLKDLEDIKQRYGEKLRDLEALLDGTRRENDAYCWQINALQQHKQCLEQTSNEWQTRYNDTKILLLSAKTEIIDLNTELRNLRISYQTDMPHIDENGIQMHSENKYLNENKQIKTENMRYLKQLKQSTHKCQASDMKCIDLNNMQIDLQNELDIARSQRNEYMDMIHQCFLEMRCLEHQNAELTHSLSESKNDKPLFDCDGNVIEISYSPKTKSNSYLRVRTPSIANTPIHTVVNGDIDFNDYEYIKSHNESMCIDISYEHDGNLINAMNGYLFEIGECVQNIKRIQLFYKKTTTKSDKAEISIDEKREIIDDDSCEDEGVEDLLKVVDNNEEEQQLARIQDIVGHLQECTAEMQKEEVSRMEHEKRKYQHLDATYKRKIKVLTKDLYSTQYKKYGGYRDICWEMLGNVGNYTKDAIIYRLTH